MIVVNSTFSRIKCVEVDDAGGAADLWREDEAVSIVDKMRVSLDMTMSHGLLVPAAAAVDVANECKIFELAKLKLWSKLFSATLITMSDCKRYTMHNGRKKCSNTC